MTRSKLLTAAVVFACATAAQGRLPAPGGQWTSLLGLKFSECEEEFGLIEGLWRALSRLFMRSSVESAHCESRETHCPSGSVVTGIEVKFGRDEADDRDLYDFKLRCGPIWREWLGMRYPRRPDTEQSDAIRCVDNTVGSGVQVIRGRDNKKDWDYFLFKLRCGLGVSTKWTDITRLPYEGNLDRGLGSLYRETRSVTCKRGLAVSGLRVYRGFQDWGDLDTYEFQLYCSPPTGSSEHNFNKGEL